MRRLLQQVLALAAVFAAAPAPGQRLDPAQWSLTPDSAAVAPGSLVVLRLEVRLEPGWHIYSPTTPPGGPIPTTLELEPNASIESVSFYQRSPSRKFDPNFNLETETFDGGAVFLAVAKVSASAPPGDAELTARVRYQLCTETQCLPPRRKTARAAIRIDPASPASGGPLPAGFLPISPAGESAPAAAPSEPPRPPARSAAPRDQGLAAFLLVAFGFGLAAIFTPCVFPMIPITVSFFLSRRPDSRRESVAQAVVFCLGIVVLFTLLGLAATALLGPFGVVQLGSNPWVNGFVAAVFLVFGLSLLGAFEITLPSGLLTRLNQASGRGGYAGTLLMGLTFSLTAFACVGPFVGTLLAASVQGGGIRPLAGMAAFASGISLPFFLLALFPSYLQRLPRAGGWMARVKVVLGFVILAAMFKYLSNVDQVFGWQLLTRERFLAIWIVLFALPGLYLLGFLRLEGVRPEDHLGVSRLLAGTAFLVFSLSLAPGLFGGRLGELDAYVPLAAEGGRWGAPADAGPRWMKNQYEEALSRARAEGKLVLLSFTGYACTNCHWMKANMFPRTEIAAALGELVLAELYTDGADEASGRNQQLQERMFSTVAIPYYAILTPDERVVATFGGLTRDSAEFLAFLKSR